MKAPNYQRLRELFIELEFHSLARDTVVETPVERAPEKILNYVTIDTVEGLHQVVQRAREVGVISLDTEALVDPDSPQTADPLRASLIALAVGVAEGEAYYFPLRHRLPRSGQVELLVDVAGDRSATDAPEERGLIRGGDEVVAEPPARKRKTNGDATSIAARTIIVPG